MSKRSIQDWFNLYGESHQNRTNKLIHWVCVPAIYFCVIGLLASIPPAAAPIIGAAPWAKAAVGAVLVGFYLPRSIPLMLGMAAWSWFCIWLSCYLLAHAAWPLWGICTALFAVAWVGQFIGHGIEGRKPSFLTDLQFLLVGPAWLMGFIYRRLGIPY